MITPSESVDAETILRGYIKTVPDSRQEGCDAITSVEVFAIADFLYWLLENYNTSEKPAQEKEHHAWCNFFMQPRAGCKMCERLYRDYPMDVPIEEMVRKYFPEAVSRT